MAGGPNQRRAQIATAAVILAAVAWETFVVLGWRATGDSTSTLRVVGSGVTGFLFIFCGLVARWRTPYARMGWVLVIAGALWMGEDVALVDTSFGNALSQFTQESSSVGFTLAALAFPTGYLRGRVDRVLVVAAVLEALVLTPLSSIINDCACGGQGTLSVRVSRGVDSALGSVRGIVGVAIVAGVVAVFLYRWWRATRPERRMVSPFLAAGAVIALVNVAKIINNWDNPVGNFLPLSFSLAPLAVLMGLARVRMVRVEVGSIVRQIDSTASLPQLRDALQRSLGDKRIAVLTWDPASSAWRDEEGRPRAADMNAAGAEVTAIDDRDGAPLGALVHDPALAHDPELLQAVLSAIRLALENASLHREVTTQLERAADAADGERRRVARDLHDGAQQRLVALMLDAAALQSRIEAYPAVAGDAEIGALLQALKTGAQASLSDLRRLVHGLAPAALASEGLSSAIRELSFGVPAEVVVDCQVTGRLPAAIESGAFMIVAEALANVSKHADARVVRVSIEHDDRELRIAVSDDGAGGADIMGGSGLRGLQERAEALGGKATVTSPPGAGTTVGATLPLLSRALLTEAREG